MFEAFEKLQNRDAGRVDPNSVRPVEIKTARDLQAVLSEFDPARGGDGPEVLLRTVVQGEDENGLTKSYSVSAPTRSKSKRTILLEGMEALKRHRELQRRREHDVIPVSVNGRDMAPPVVVDGDAGAYVDPLIKQWTGGYRSGLSIRWDLPDGHTYNYCVFTHKLTKTAAVRP